jgi:transcriptional regulator with XRE-family HTH domain
MEPSIREGFAKRLRELMEKDFRRNRAALADAIHVSPSALSQYARGHATPSLEVLAALAKALNVSLDYLVLGEEPLLYPADYSYWAGHMEGLFRRLTAQSASLRDYVGRIGAELAQRIEVTAREVLDETKAIGGVLTPAELIGVERYSVTTRIATVDLDLEVLVPKDGGEDVTPAPGPLLQTVADNVVRGRRYEYVIPEGAEWARKAGLLRDQILEEVAGRAPGSEPMVDRCVRFHQSDHALVPGFVIYSIEHQSLAQGMPRLHDQISVFIIREGEAVADLAAGIGLVAAVEPMSLRQPSFQLIARENVPRLLNEYVRIRQQSSLLTFPPALPAGGGSEVARRA